MLMQEGPVLRDKSTWESKRVRGKVALLVDSWTGSVCPGQSTRTPGGGRSQPGGVSSVSGKLANLPRAEVSLGAVLSCTSSTSW